MRIHLIENEGFIKPLPNSNGEEESGYWVVSEDTANALVGGEIYFHRAQAEPSFYGGRILGFRVDAKSPYPGRVVFRFRDDRACKGISAGRDSWGLEKKVVL